MFGGRLLLLLQDLNRKKCDRCSLHYEKHHDRCPLCSNMNDFELKIYLEERGIDPNAKSGLGQLLIFAAIVALIIFLLSQIIRT